MPAPTDTTAYPAFTSKAQMLTEILRELESGAKNVEQLMYRLSNTNTSTFADPTARNEG